MIRGFYVIAVIILSNTISNLAFAGSFKVNPLALQFDDKTKSVVVKITNTGEHAVTVQMDGMRWTQDVNGEDQFAETTDIIFFPKIVTIERGDERVIRVGYNGDSKLASERTYRFYAQELPSRNTPGGLLNFTLRFSIPIFVKPNNAVVKTKITDANFSQGQAKISIRNEGNEHILVTRITANGYDGTNRLVFENDVGGWYVLPGATKMFSVAVPDNLCILADAVEISAKYEDQILTSRSRVKSSECNSIANKNNDRFANQ